MTEKLPSTSFIVSMAFLCGFGAAAAMITGLGMIVLVTVSDNAFAPLVQGVGIGATIVAFLALIAGLILVGLRRDNRVRWVRIAAVTGAVLIVYVLATAITSLFVTPGNGWLVALSGVFVFVSPATFVLVLATAVATWAFFGSLGWQARNGETRQYLAPGD
jgi:hypothetical protein